MNKVELNAIIKAGIADIDYCEKEIISLAENVKQYPVNKGYAEKETAKLKDIIRSHKIRIEKAEAAIAEIEAVEKVEEVKEEFTGKKFVKCRRCAGTGFTGFKHVNNGVCFGCQGTGSKKSKAYLVFLGEWYEDVCDPRWIF